MDFDTGVKLAIYGFFARNGNAPTPPDLASELKITEAELLECYERLRSQRVLALEDDGSTIRMAPPFSGVPTQHVVESGDTTYHANCAWDALGIPAALGRAATVRSRCEQSREPLVLQVTETGPEASDWLFHCLVPAAHWWDDIVYT